MTLADLRKIAVRKQVRIRFRIANGMDCVVNEHGVAQVPALKTIPDFNLERELEAVSRFTVEPAVAADAKHPAAPQPVDREELAAMAAGGPAGPAHDHEEE